tara:strand:- start:413 stop:898 length:486 start_codon:yes stop_codon:yes gene_type:complete
MIITLLRKPLDGSVAENTLKHGCGAINIDATRVGNEVMVSTAMSSLGVMHDDNWESKPVDPRESSGRWPANFILTHLENCELDGKETVANWDCAEGCPVKELDQQSGRVKGWSSQSHNTFNPYQGNSFHNSSTQRQGYKEGYNDDGGASRFFKQFKKANDQ